MCVKNWQSEANPKSLVVYWRTGGRSVYLISLGVSIPGRPRASIAAIFRQSAGYVYYFWNRWVCLLRIFESFTVFYRLCFLCKIFYRWFCIFESLLLSWHFCVLRDLNFSHSQFHPAELNWRQFNIKSQNEICAKTLSFFTLFYCGVVISVDVIRPPSELFSPPQTTPLTEIGYNWLELALVREQFFPR